MLFQAQYFFPVYMKTLWLVRLWKTQFMSQSGELSVRVFAHTSKDRPTLRSIHQCTWPKRPTAYVLCHLLCPMVPPDKLFYEFTLEATFSPYEINIISVSAVSSWVSSSPKRQLQCTFWQLFKVTVLWSFCMPFSPTKPYCFHHAILSHKPSSENVQMYCFIGSPFDTDVTTDCTFFFLYQSITVTRACHLYINKCIFASSLSSIMLMVWDLPTLF